MQFRSVEGVLRSSASEMNASPSWQSSARSLPASVPATEFSHPLRLHQTWSTEPTAVKPAVAKTWLSNSLNTVEPPTSIPAPRAVEPPTSIPAPREWRGAVTYSTPIPAPREWRGAVTYSAPIPAPIPAPVPAASLSPDEPIWTWEERYEDLAAFSYFSVDEIRQLHQKFIDVSRLRVDDGKLDEAEFKCALVLNMNNQAAASISKQLFTRFDENQNGEIDFGEFVMALSVLSENAPFAEKVQLSFELFEDGKNRLDKHSIKRIMLPSLSGAGLRMAAELDSTDEMLANAVDHAVWHCSSPPSNEQYMNFVEYSKFCAGNPQVLDWLTFELRKTTWSEGYATVCK